MDQIATEIFRPVVQLLMVPVREFMSSVVYSSNHVRKMHNRMDDLNATLADVKTKKETNNARDLEEPHRIEHWLEAVETTKAQAERILIGGHGCFDVKMRYKLGKRSCELLEEIERHIKETPEIKWTKIEKPLGKVDSKMASSSTPFDVGAQSSNLESRDMIFKQALEYLNPNQTTQKIALCGMGGVGKTTMMEKLEKAVEKSKMFDWVLKVVIGQNPNPINVQQAISEQLGEPIKETIKETRAKRLQERFKSISQDGRKLILVILDDIWEEIDLNDIGLTNPLPTNFKLLLTSRERQACTNMGVETGLIIRMKVLNDSEAVILFDEIAGISYRSDPELLEIGEHIRKRCGGLPIAIKIIASTLRDNYGKDAWADALSGLQHSDSQYLNDTVNEVFEISYKNLKDEDKSTFILSGLFPDDFNIPLEELMRYAWGLKLFPKVYHIPEARRRVNTSVGRLINANLLIKSDKVGCIKMHDLVRAFVLSNFSKFKQASVVNYNDRSQWPAEDASKSCERILLKCTGMKELHEDFNYPNLKLLKIMDGDERLRFPKDFYQTMKNLEVVAYERMNARLLPVVPQYLTKLRTLCIHSCSLMDDFSFLGNLVNLEILSFANSRIRKFPSTIGKLTKLKLLDFTGCGGLFIDDDNLFQNLANIEELYMGKVVKVTDASCKQFEMLSGKLFSLDIELLEESKVQPKHMSFKNLERFKISMGCSFSYYDEDFKYSFNKTLKLRTNSNEIKECKINDLFKKTENLRLQVDDMTSLEDISSMDSSPHSFFNLRVLQVDDCADLRYLFTIPVANGLPKLKSLIISKCPVLEALIHDENSGAEVVITFQELKFMDLKDLPKLVSLCDNGNVVELPQLADLRLYELPNFTSIYSKDNKGDMQPIFCNEDATPKLEILVIGRMENLKHIWACETMSKEEAKVSTLRQIEVSSCNEIVNLFPSNPFPLLSHLEKLKVKECASIEVLFNMDLGCAGEINEEEVRVDDSFSHLRSIEAIDSKNLTEVWRIKGVNNSPHLCITWFQAVESIKVEFCRKFRNLISPTTSINIDLRALRDLTISPSSSLSSSLSSSSGDNVNVVSPSNLIHNLKNLHRLVLEGTHAEVVFEIQGASSKERDTTHDTQQSPILPNLEELNLECMNRLRHVWKCNWNQQQESSFHNLTTIYMYRCKSVKFLFSPLMAKLLVNLKNVVIKNCHDIEEVVSNRDDGFQEITTSTSTSPDLFPHLDILDLTSLPSLKCIGGGSNEICVNNTTAIDDRLKFPQAEVLSWSLCQYARTLDISFCPLSSVIPSYALGQMQKLEVMRITSCHSMMEVFETRGINKSTNSSTNIDRRCSDTNTIPTIPRTDNISMLKLPNLKELDIYCCDNLEYIFTFSTLDSLKKLEKLKIKDCKGMKVIVKEENGEQTKAHEVVVFPNLREVEISGCDNLEYIFTFSTLDSLKKLEKLTILYCEGMKVIVKEENGEQTKAHEVVVFPNLKELKIRGCDNLEYIFTFSTLDSLKKLEKLKIEFCDGMKVIVKEENGEQTKAHEVVVFPRLKSIILVNLPNLVGFFLGMNEFQWTALDDVVIEVCPQMLVFTSGPSTTPKLKYIRTGIGKRSLEGAHNFNVVSASYKTQFTSLDGISLCPATFDTEPWLSHNLIELEVQLNRNIKKIVPSTELLKLETLQKISVDDCHELEEVFEAPEEGTNSDFNESIIVVGLPSLTELELTSLYRLKYIWKSNRWMALEFPNLTTLSLYCCHNLQYVFTCSMLGSLMQLQELKIRRCENIEVIVKEEEEESEGKVNEITLPSLKSLKLDALESLQGFCLGKEVFSWPALDTIEIRGCPKITVFTKGRSAVPEQTLLETNFGLDYAGEDINYFIATKQQERYGL